MTAMPPTKPFLGVGHFHNSCMSQSTEFSTGYDYGYMSQQVVMKDKFQNPKSFRKIHEFEFDKTGLKCHLPNHGISVIIPENAVNGKALLRIGVYFVDSFQFPEDYRLVSDVFWIDSNTPLHEKATVQLYIPHCVMIKNKNDLKNLRVFLAPDVSFKRSGVFKFTEANKQSYSFEPDNYGKLLMNHFCSGCILKKESSGLPLEYLVTRVIPINRDRPSWNADFVFSYALPTCQKVCLCMDNMHRSELILDCMMLFYTGHS